MQLNAISLFSGAMGLDLGIEKAGFTIRVCCEMNRHACDTIRRNTDIPVAEGDISQIPTSQILQKAGVSANEVDLIVGGPPCQAFSSAGRQRGLADLRGNVIIEYLRVLADVRPKFFILENVRGLLSAKLNVIPSGFEPYSDLIDKKGSVLFFLAQKFKELGYTISFALFNAANYGVPQIRERMIVFGHLGEERIPLPNPTHSENGENGLCPWISLEDAIEGLPEAKDSEYIQLREHTKKYVSILNEGQNWTDLPKELAQEAMGKAYFLQGGKTGFLRRLALKRPAPTLVTSPTMPATLLCHPTELRPLSIREYARIQQFPDTWVFSGKIIDIYRQIGNAVPVGLGYMAGKNIIDFINGECCKETPKTRYSRYCGTTDKEFFLSFSRHLQKEPTLFD